MKSWFLVPILSTTLLVSARADDLNARAAGIKSQLQTSWLPAWAAKSPANESATDAAYLLETLSHAHRLGYSTPQLNLLDAARVHYRLLRDSRRDKTNDGFFDASGGNQPFKDTRLQARVVLALVEYARASNEAEPRGLAIKTWRLIRDRGRDKVNGGYFDGFLSGPLTPTQASAGGNKAALTHLALLEAGTALVEFTRDRSIKNDLVELLDLNEGRFFPARVGDSEFTFTSGWKPYRIVIHGIGPEPDSIQPGRKAGASVWDEAGVAIARAQVVLGVPVRWIDLTHRAGDPDVLDLPSTTTASLSALASLARNIPTSRERRAVQIDEVLDSLNGQTPDVHSGAALLDFVAAFHSSSGE